MSFPAWVYRRGSRPDPRFSLANDRTFLAWIRTSLALLAGGMALEALKVPIRALTRANVVPSPGVPMLVLTGVVPSLGLACAGYLLYA